MVALAPVAFALMALVSLAFTPCLYVPQLCKGRIYLNNFRESTWESHFLVRRGVSNIGLGPLASAGWSQWLPKASGTGRKIEHREL